MRLHRPRFTLRWMMFLVLLVALLLFGVQIGRTRQFRRLKAAEYKLEEAEWRLALPQLEMQLAKGRGGNPRFAGLTETELKRELDAIREVHENHRLWAEYSLSLARWYEHGASRPWQRLGTEPPLPRELDGER